MFRLFKKQKTAGQQFESPQDLIDTYYRREAILFCFKMISANLGEWSHVTEEAIRNTSSEKEQKILRHIQSLLVMLSYNDDFISEWLGYQSGLLSSTEKLFKLDDGYKHQFIVTQLSFFDELFPDLDKCVEEALENMKKAKKR
jgi:hypothetical protein